MTLLSANVVITPIDEQEKYRWLAEEFEKVKSKKVLIASPITNNKKLYLYKGMVQQNILKVIFIQIK